MFLFRSTVWADNYLCAFEKKSARSKQPFIWVAVVEILILLNNKNIYANRLMKSYSQTQGFPTAANLS